MKKLLFIILYLYTCTISVDAALVNLQLLISGTPVPITNANINITDQRYEVDSKGQLQLDLDPGEYKLVIQATGYDDKTIQLEVADTNINKTIELDVKIVVTAATQIVTSDKVSVGYQRIDGQSIKRLTEATVIPDVINSLKLLPGVSSDSSTSSSIYIRGGDRTELISLIDNIPIRTPYFFGGANSIFNPKTIEEVEFYPGGYGAEFGQALSGIIDIKSLDGSSEYIYGSVDASLLELNSFLNIPVIKDTSALTIAFRRTHYDIALNLAKKLALAEESASTLPSYYSLEAKYVHELTAKQSLELSYRDYISQMDFLFEDDDTAETSSFDIYNDLNIISAQLESQLSKTLFNRFLVAKTVSTGKYEIDTTDFSFVNNYDQPQSFFRNDLTFSASDRHQIDLGGFFYNYIEDTDGQYNFVYTDDWDENEASVTVNVALDSLVRLAGVYIKDTFQLTPRLVLDMGTRLSLFKVESNSIRSYLQPRLSMLYNINEQTTFKSYVGTYRQIGQDGNSTFQDDGTLKTVIPDLNMEQSIQYGAGFERYIRKDIVLKSEYYRKDYLGLFMNEATEPETIYSNNGKGYSRGVEFMLQQLEGGKQHGWISYTLSDTKKFDEDGWYRPEYDLTHMATLYYEKKLKDNKSIILSSQVRSGKRYTPLVLADDGSYSEGPLFSERLKPYIMLDIWYQFPDQIFDLDCVYRIGLTNVLNRKNQYSYRFNSDTNEPEIAYDFPSFRFLIVGFELFF